MPNVVGVRFQRGCRVYDFDAGAFVLSAGEMVLVETEMGLALGQVARAPHPLPVEEPSPEPQAALLPPAPIDHADSAPSPAELTEAAEGAEPAQRAEPLAPEDPPAPAPPAPPAPERPPLKKVYRPATPEDLAQAQANAAVEKEAHAYCLERIAARRLEMHLVRVECLFDRSKILFYFTADGRLDFRDLVRDLVAKLRTRVELRQIGVRHEAKLLGGLGSCGRELCCSSWLKDFEPVSVKMAKEQNLSLNPTKISGLCGRLMCCLTYEYPVYQELRRDLPKLGKRLTLGPELEAKVVRLNILERKVTLYLSDGREVTCTPEEIPNLGTQPQPPPPSRGNRVPPPQPKPQPQPQPPAEPAPAAGDGAPAPEASSQPQPRPRRRSRHRPKGQSES